MMHRSALLTLPHEPVVSLKPMFLRFISFMVLICKTGPLILYFEQPAALPSDVFAKGSSRKSKLGFSRSPAHGYEARGQQSD